MGKDFIITKNEGIFLGVIVLISTLITNIYWYRLLDIFPPVVSFLIYEIGMLTTLIILAHYGLIIFNIHIEKKAQIFGTLLIVFIFFMSWNWENPLVQYSTTGSFGGANHIFYGSEDGILWNLWSWILHTTDKSSLFSIWLTWFFCFPFSTLIIGFIALLFARLEKVRW